MKFYFNKNNIFLDYQMVIFFKIFIELLNSIDITLAKIF